MMSGSENARFSQVRNTLPCVSGMIRVLFPNQAQIPASKLRLLLGRNNQAPYLLLPSR